MVERCNANGTAWLSEVVCNAASGQSCGPGGQCAPACQLAAAAKGSTGCRFWAVDLDNAFVPGGTQSYYDGANAPFAVVLSNVSASLSAEFSITSNIGPVLLDGKSAPLDLSPIPPLGLRVLYLPARNVEGTTQDPLAYRVDTTAPVAAYQFNPLENVGVYSNDASLLLPEVALGQDYIAMSRAQSFTILRGFLTVVATSAGTTQVQLTFGPTTLQTLGGTAKALVNGQLSESPIASYTSNATAYFSLLQGDVLNIETNKVGADLTGTRVHADHNVAVFAGSEAANAPDTIQCNVSKCTESQRLTGSKCGVCQGDKKTPCHSNEHCSQFLVCCADHLEMQLPAVSQWGSDHVAVKFEPRGKEGDLWRILAAQNDTHLTFDPVPTDSLTGQPVAPAVLQAGGWVEIDTRDSFEVFSAFADGTPAPVMVGHFMASQDSPGPGEQAGDAGTGDPAFSLAVPRAQCAAYHVFSVPPKFASSWISIAGPSTANVAVDGETLPSTAWKPINSTHKFARLPMAPGTHRVLALADPSGSSAKISVEVYGHDQYVSYAYPAGMGLVDLGLGKGK